MQIRDFSTFDFKSLPESMQMYEGQKLVKSISTIDDALAFDKLVLSRMPESTLKAQLSLQFEKSIKKSRVINTVSVSLS
ncbi:hypothetical protein SOPP22_15370 [Shewanella sp. OPT22]|nr:hypothetical protein SOPP22_15370 [Shewanella sp. OPT22]